MDSEDKLGGSAGNLDTLSAGTARATDAERKRQSKPKPPDFDFREGGMTLLWISTEELGMLGLTSGAGSVATSFALIFGKEAYTASDPLLMFAAAAFVVTSVTIYILLFGLIRRIRKRNNLKKWAIFGE